MIIHAVTAPNILATKYIQNGQLNALSITSNKYHEAIAIRMLDTIIDQKLSRFKVLKIKIIIKNTGNVITVKTIPITLVKKGVTINA